MTILDRHIEIVKQALHAYDWITSWSVSGEPDQPYTQLTARSDDLNGQPVKLITVKLKKQNLLDLDYIKSRIKEAFNDRRKNNGG